MVSPRLFNKELSETPLNLKTVSLRRCENDPCLHQSNPPDRLSCSIYVNDFRLASDSERTLEDFVNELGRTFKFTSRNLELLFCGLRINVSPERGRIQINQGQYLTELLAGFNISNRKTSSTPIDATSKSACEENADLGIEPRGVVSGSMYASVACTADRSYAVGSLSRYLDKPTKHLQCVAMIELRYFSGTKNFGPKYVRNAFNNMKEFSDADWAECHATLRSTSGITVLFGGNPVTGRSQRQQ